MKKTNYVLLLLVTIVLAGCNENDIEKIDKFDRFMSELDCPVVLIGKTDKAVNYPAIVVRDGKGRVRTFKYGGHGGYSGMPQAISESREVGDTLKPCIDTKIMVINNN